MKSVFKTRAEKDHLLLLLAVPPQLASEPTIIEPFRKALAFVIGSSETMGVRYRLIRHIYMLIYVNIYVNIPIIHILTLSENINIDRTFLKVLISILI